MEELIKLVAEKTGLPEAQAKVAVDTVLDFLKKKLPEPLAAQIDGLLSGGNLGGLFQGLGGMLGSR